MLFTSVSTIPHTMPGFQDESTDTEERGETKVRCPETQRSAGQDSAMSPVSEPADRKCKTTAFNTVQALTEKADTMHQQVRHLSRDEN